jgi:putative ABC transport system ATP-binding protein
MTVLLRMNDIRRTFRTMAGPVDAIKNVDLEVAEGEFVMITGPSGSGKSTLLGIAALLDRPTAGDFHLMMIPVHRIRDRERCALRRDRIGMVFQGYHLLPRRSVLDNILFRYRYQRVDRARVRRRALAVAERLDLGARLKQPGYLLSGGEMQRVAIARAIVHQPDLLVADEPTGNLDEENAQKVMQVFTQLNRDGLSIMMVTHNPALHRFAHRTMRFRSGILGHASP